MTHWSEKLLLTADDTTFTVSEISALLGMLEERGIDTASALEAAHLRPEMLNDPATRVSLTQQYRVQRAAEGACGDRRFSMLLAQRLHLTAYGIAGYALLSSSTLTDVIRFAELYSPLLNLKFSLELRVTGATASLRFVDRYAMDDAMRMSCRVLEMAKMAVLLRDVLGEDFRPRSARCPSADASQGSELSDMLGVTVEASGESAEICFDAALLDRPLRQSHAGTHAACLQVCEGLVASLSVRFDLVRQVKDIILKASGRAPTLSEIADILCMSQRTLRRRLETLETSYNEILEDVRKELAIRYLTTTHLTTETIAEMLGYSEAANFRHAFKRWTGASPRHYCASRGTTSRGSGQFSARMADWPLPRNHGAVIDSAVECWS